MVFNNSLNENWIVFSQSFIFRDEKNKNEYTTYPISNIQFPAVTVCNSNMFYGRNTYPIRTKPREVLFEKQIINMTICCVS